MTRRTYQQYCPLALSLETVGERWSLLIVRELLGGPKRYTDLRDGLGAISPTLLASRLAELEEAGVIEKQELPPPAARTVYALTAEGRDLGPVLAELTRWGMRRLPEPDVSHRPRPVMAARTALLAYAKPFPPADDERTYEVHVDDQAFTFVFADGAIELHDGPSPTGPGLVATTTAADLIRLRQGTLSAREAIGYEPRNRSRIEQFEEAFGFTRRRGSALGGVPARTGHTTAPPRRENHDRPGVD